MLLRMPKAALKPFARLAKEALGKGASFFDIARFTKNATRQLLTDLALDFAERKD